MKKALAILLLFLYSFPLLSNNCSLHFCGGMLKSVSFFTFTNKYNCCGAKKMPVGCCKDVKFLTKADNHEATSLLKTGFNKEINVAILAAVTNGISAVCNAQIHQVKYDPPDLIGLRLHLVNSVFRI